MWLTVTCWEEGGGGGGGQPKKVISFSSVVFDPHYEMAIFLYEPAKSNETHDKV
jgi:hypothetical protein